MKYYYKIEDEAGNTLVDGFESVLEAIDYARAHYGKKFGRVVRYIVVPNVLSPATTFIIGSVGGKSK